MAKRPCLRLVGVDDPASVFDDLDALRRSNGDPALRHKRRTVETFARIPHDRGLDLYHHLGGPAWAILIELDRLIFKGRGRNPVKLSNHNLKRIGLTRSNKYRGLRRLETAGVISIVQRGGPGEGCSPLILHHWYPTQD
jgi:hypothetical protein